MPLIAVREYIAPSGKFSYARWFERLDAVAAARVATAVYRLSEGNFSNTKGVGAGVFETRIDVGPGYRVYFGKDGESVVILLGGSAKRDQQRAIEQAKAALGGIQDAQGPPAQLDREQRMALTRDFRETIMARAQRDAKFRHALFTESLNAYLAGDSATGKAILRDLINATIGFEGLAAEINKPSKSLHRMLGEKGNPSTENFFDILGALQRKTKVRLAVTAK